MNLPTDSVLVDLAAATYQPGREPFLATVDGAMKVFHDDADGLSIFSIEGTHDPLGWAFDFCALGIEAHQGITNATLGFVHSGFWTLSETVYPQIKEAAAKGPFALDGHSLGAAMALLLGARLILDGLKPAKIGAFAPPRVGGSLFVQVATSVPFCAYHYGNDPVPRVPFRIMPPLPLPQFPYVQVLMIDVGAPMPDEFNCHHVQNYVQAVHAREAAG